MIGRSEEMAFKCPNCESTDTEQWNVCFGKITRICNKCKHKFVVYK